MHPRTAASQEDDPANLLHGVLDLLARRRLAAGGLDRREVEHLVVRESGGRDDWLAFLVLTPWDEVEELLRSHRPDREAP